MVNVNGVVSMRPVSFSLEIACMVSSLPRSPR
jgi:hypothetical protein